MGPLGGLGGTGSESVKLMFLRKAPAPILGPGRCGVGRASDGLTGGLGWACNKIR
jgi:hypothetical protein